MLKSDHSKRKNLSEHTLAYVTEQHMLALWSEKAERTRCCTLR